MGQIRKTIQMLTTAGISVAAMMIAVGCADTTAPAQGTAGGVRGDVTDVRPLATATPASYQPPAYDNSGVIPMAPQPVTPPPVAIATPALDATADALISSTPTAKSIGSISKKHTVRKGETLFSIAKVSYGDGKMWKKIVAANPGVSPSKLKVGQVIVLPA
jgi:5'-nucleotidase/UDP-sugar diphosphatase